MIIDVPVFVSYFPIMARIARLVVPGYAHHVTQRGVRRMATFMQDSDYSDYLTLVSEACKKAGTEVWGYCLMPNHVHLIMVPSHKDGLRAALGEAHRRYTRMINFREGARGHLWQERFASFVMDGQHLVTCARYVELNPVRAGMVPRPEDWAWSSARAHLEGNDDALAKVSPLLEEVPDWAALLQGGVEDAEMKRLQMHTRTGRPLGADAWVEHLEKQEGRRLAAQRPGRPKKTVSDDK